MLDGDTCSSLPIWPQVEGPFLRRKRMIRLRVRFIKMLDMETITSGMMKDLLLQTGLQKQGTPGGRHVGRGQQWK